MNSMNGHNGGVRPWDPKIIQWITRYSGGMVQGRKQAEYVLVAFFCAAIVIIGILLLTAAPNQPSQGPVPANQFVP